MAPVAGLKRRPAERQQVSLSQHAKMLTTLAKTIKNGVSMASPEVQ